MILHTNHIYYLTAVCVIGLLSCAQTTPPKKPLPTAATASTTPPDTLWTTPIQKTDAEWKAALTDKQYYVLREKGTERAYSSPLYKVNEVGLYSCAACANPLFYSDTKFDAQCGWPSFFKTYSSKSVVTQLDKSHGMLREEVLCARCKGHLGHVFEDGPPPTGLRYCMNGEALTFQKASPFQSVVFAQGCFWCVEEIFEQIKGVQEAIAGYAGGKETNPSYESVGSGKSDHAESLKIVYDSTVISYKDLLKVYFAAGDVTQVDGQGPDRGRQYRSIIFYNDAQQRQQAQSYIDSLTAAKVYDRPIAVELLPFTHFYEAEDYHQDFVQRNPNQGYVRGVSKPRCQRAVQHFPDLLKQQ